MEILQLQYFCEAARCENFSRVAEKFYVPQSSISHAVARLEEELGVRLFARSGKKVTLNENGKAYYEKVNRALTLLTAGNEQIKSSGSGRVRIAMREGTVAMIAAVAAFRREYPQIEIEFTNPSERLRGSMVFDLRVGARPFERDDDYAFAPLFTERILTAVPAGSPLAKKRALTIEDIRTQPIIGLYSGSKMYRQMSAYFELHEYAPKIKIESENHATVAEFVKNGFGIAFFPEISWSAVQKDGIVSLPFADFDARRTVYLAWQKDTERSAAAICLAEFLQTYFKGKR